jgi:serine/threonine protein kinase
MPEPGEMLGDFRLVARLCDPSRGDVWKAVDQRSDREVALKILPDAITGDAERLERYTRDNRTVAAGLHPNIVRVHSIESVDDLHVVSMELVDGKPLDRYVPSGGLAPEAFVAIALQLTDALRTAHEGGVIHRALSPGNVMIRADGVVQVLDFGLAEIRELENDPMIDTDDIPTLTLSLTGEGVILDSLPYMSPEQIRGRPLDARSDVFSVGTLLYEMATGRRAFPGETSADIFVGILRDQPPGITALNRAMSPLYGQLVFHCLEKIRDRRFQSVEELHEALGSLDD